MFSGIRRLIGAPSVQEDKEKGIIKIDGLSSSSLATDLSRIWSTSRIGNNMLINVSGSSISFLSFFAIEVRYALNVILENPGRYTEVRTIRRVIELLEENTWLSNINEFDGDTLDIREVKRMRASLKPAQEEYFRIFSRIRPKMGLLGYMLASPPGTGKTISSLAVALGAKRDHTIIVCPKIAVHDVWAKTFDIWFHETPTYWTSLQPTKPEKKHEFMVFHYEALGKALEFVLANKDRSYSIILDECHNMNTAESLRTIQFVDLCKESRSSAITWMSGTPIKAIGSEAIPFLKTIDPLFTDTAAQAMMKIFGKSASRANDILANRIGLTSFKVDKAEVVSLTVNTYDHKFTFAGAEKFTLDAVRAEISAFVVERAEYYKKHFTEFETTYNHCLKIHESHLNGKQLEDFRKYNEYVRTIRRGFDPVMHKEIARYCTLYEKKNILPTLPDRLRKEFLNARSVVKYVDLKIRGEALGRILGRRRIDCFAAMVEHSGIEEFVRKSEKKTVVFTSYIDVVENLKKYFDKLGFKPVVVYGDTVKNLPAIVKQFDKDYETNPLIATYDSLSTAVPLVMANTCILFNQPFRQYVVDQATARVARMDQDSPVHIINVLLDTKGQPNISTRSLDLVEWSRQQVDVIMGNSSALDDMSLESFGIDINDELPGVPTAGGVSVEGYKPPSMFW